MDGLFHDAMAGAVSAKRFVLFGGLHLTILALTLVIPALMSALTRRAERPRVARWTAGILATILVLDYVFTVVWGVRRGEIIYWENALPMQLCDWASVACIFALVWRHQLAYELAYFWGLSGTLQALLTPDVKEAFPDPLFISFFVSHCGILIAVFFMTWGLKRRPLPGSVWRAWLWSQLYLMTAGLVDWLFHAHQANFGYLDDKPANGSLMNFFGPWPWYILVLEALSLIFYAGFYLPFWLADRRQRLNR